MNKNKLQKILSGLSNFDSGLGDAFKSVEDEMKKVANKLREEAEIKTVEMAKKRINELKERIQAIVDSIENLKEELGQNEKNLSNNLTKKLDLLRTAMSEFRTADTERVKILSEDIGNLKEDIQEISQRKTKIPDFASKIREIQLELENEILKLKNNSDEQLKGQSKDFQKKLDKFEETIIELRKSTMSALASKGGQANRNILVGNNPSTLSRYTDLNILAGSNVTLSYTNNDNLKTTNLTIAATGGGSNRNISTVSVSSVVAAVTSTDYVVIASAGVLLTLPTAVSNTNLYTIKNTAASSVMVAANGVETIDGSANITLTTQYTAVDLISDNANWHVT